jgi:hypothetical protein
MTSSSRIYSWLMPHGSSETKRKAIVVVSSVSVSRHNNPWLKINQSGKVSSFLVLSCFSLQNLPNALMMFSVEILVN